MNYIWYMYSKYLKWKRNIATDPNDIKRIIMKFHPQTYNNKFSNIDKYYLIHTIYQNWHKEKIE